jgi:6-pyruvoyltetrahydropterin/6-carboxytetrahydropterin synthase
MYTLAVRRQFIARHALIGGDWGRENFQLRGKNLDQHGFLVDIVDVESHLDSLLERYRDQLLNDLPEFTGLNPSLEHFVRILALAVNERLTTRSLDRLEVVLWEDDAAWASFTPDR